MTDGPTHLRKVDPREAMVHALWESHACIGQWAFCACLAMLRKAIDIWSAVYRDQHGMTFDKTRARGILLTGGFVKLLMKISFTEHLFMRLSTASDLTQTMQFTTQWFVLGGAPGHTKAQLS